MPTLMILNAAEDRYVLISLATVDGCMEATVVENSKHLFTNAEWRSDALEGRPENYKFRRISSRSAPKIYDTSMCKTNRYLIVRWHEPIHIYTMKSCGVILPSTYFRVFKNEDLNEIWHFKKPSGAVLSVAPSVAVPSVAPSVAVPSVVPLSQPKIPSHIVRGFIESAIQKKEVCPITLDALVMGNVAMTSCGHLFERQALMNAITNSKVCPNCRASVKEGDIINV